VSRLYNAGVTRSWTRHIHRCHYTKGGQYVINGKWRTKVNVLRLVVGYPNATIIRKTWKPEPEIETKVSRQTRQNLWADRYRSGFAQPTSCWSGFWTGLVPNWTMLVVQTWTAGKLPGPIGNTSYDSSNNINHIPQISQWELCWFDNKSRVRILLNIIKSDPLSLKAAICSKLPVADYLVRNKFSPRLMPDINRVMCKCSLVATLTFPEGISISEIIDTLSSSFWTFHLGMSASSHYTWVQLSRCSCSSKG